MRGALSSASAALLLATACGPRLPEAVAPYTPTPDAPFRAAAPPAEPVRGGFRAPIVAQHRLGNGVVVLVAERHDLPIVTISYANRSGTSQESANEIGLAPLVASLLNEGTRLSDGRNLRRLNLRGRKPDVETNVFGTVLDMEVLAGDEEAAVRLLASIVQAPIFDSKAVLVQRMLQSERLFDDSMSLDSHLTQSVFGSWFGASHPLARSRLGRSETLRRLTPEQARAFHRRTYGPADSALVVVGAVDAQQIVEVAEQALGTWAAAPEYRHARLSPPRDRSASDAYEAFNVGGTHAHFLLGLATVGAEHDNHAALKLAVTLLGGRAASRLNRELRLHRGVTYGVHAAYQAGSHFGQIEIRGDLRAEDVEDSLGQLCTEIDRLGMAPLSASELGAGKASLLGALARATYSNRDLADLLVRHFIQGLPPDHYDTLAERVRTLQASDVMEGVREHLACKYMKLAIAGPPRRLGNSLADFGDARWYKLDDPDED